MHDLLIILSRVAAFPVGAAIFTATALSAIRTFVLPRSARDPITAFVFIRWRRLFDLRANRVQTYDERDRVMALFAPVALLSLPIVWLTLMTVAFALVYYTLGITSLYDAFALSGSALTTLGFARHDGWLIMALTFFESGVGLILVALLISYLPTMYSAFSAREAAVSMLSVRAGSPPSAVELLRRAQRIDGMNLLADLWKEWEMWFAAVEESHTSLAALVFFRSPKPETHWTTAGGTVLDAASLYMAAVDGPDTPQARLCIRAGYLALRSVADYYRMEYDHNPQPDDPISISRTEFEAALDQMAEQGVPLKPDRDAAWLAFSGWRVNYDLVLLKIAALTTAPYAQWVSDRSIPGAKHPAHAGSWRHVLDERRKSR